MLEKRLNNFYTLSVEKYITKLICKYVAKNVGIYIYIYIIDKNSYVTEFTTK